MKSFFPLLSLATLGTAVDLRFYWDSTDCNGNYIACNNVNPNFCCFLDSGAASSARWNAVPREWDIWGRRYPDNHCQEGSDHLELFLGSSESSYCRGDRGNIRSLNYFFPGGRKRGEELEKCSESVRADTVGLADGRVYSLKGMGREKERKFVGWASGEVVSVEGGEEGFLEGFREFLVV